MSGRQAPAVRRVLYMKQRIISILAVITLIIGLSLLLYPTISNYFNSTKQRRAIYNYVATVETISEEDYSDILEKAERYNAALAASPPKLMELTDRQLAEYMSILDVTGTGIIGYISIPTADISLPVYHGTSEAVLQVGAGHLEGSSFPIAGDSVHALISGHRGLPSALLFTNLDMLEVGDTFTVHVLDEAYTYRIYDIETVLPSDLYSLNIQQGKDLCTLITCTPYGINSHRLLIHGERIFIPEIEEKLAIQSGARFIDCWKVVLILEIPILIISVVVFTRRTKKMR